MVASIIQYIDISDKNNFIKKSIIKNTYYNFDSFLIRKEYIYNLKDYITENVYLRFVIKIYLNGLF